MWTQIHDVIKMLFPALVYFVVFSIIHDSNGVHALGTKRIDRILRGPHVCGTTVRHCCHGWQLSPTSFDCTIPFCRGNCGPGGKCISAMRCLCADGKVRPSCYVSETREKRSILTKGGVFLGRCSNVKGVCHHRCHDLPNQRFECACREGYKLSPNQQSCRREHHGTHIRHHTHHDWRHSQHSHHWMMGTRSRSKYYDVFTRKHRQELSRKRDASGSKHSQSRKDFKEEKASKSGVDKFSVENSLKKKTHKGKEPYDGYKEKGKQQQTKRKDESASTRHHMMGMFSDYRKRMMTMRDKMMTRMHSKRTTDFSKSKKFGCKHCQYGKDDKTGSIHDKEGDMTMKKKFEYFDVKDDKSEIHVTPKKMRNYEEKAMQGKHKSYLKDSKGYKHYKQLSQKGAGSKLGNQNYKKGLDEKGDMKKQLKGTDVKETKEKDQLSTIQPDSGYAVKKILKDDAKKYHKDSPVSNQDIKYHDKEKQILNSKVKAKDWIKPETVHPTSKIPKQEKDSQTAVQEKPGYPDKQMQAKSIHKRQNFKQKTNPLTAFKEKPGYLDKQMQAKQILTDKNSKEDTDSQNAFKEKPVYLNKQKQAKSSLPNKNSKQKTDPLTAFKENLGYLKKEHLFTTKPISNSQKSKQDTDALIVFKQKLGYLEKQMQADQTDELAKKYPKPVSDEPKYKTDKLVDADKSDSNAYTKNKPLDPNIGYDRKFDHKNAVKDNDKTQTDKKVSLKSSKSSSTAKPDSKQNSDSKVKIPGEVKEEKKGADIKDTTLSKATQNKLHLRAKMLSSMREQFMDPRMASLLKALRKQRRQQTKGGQQQKTKATKSKDETFTPINSEEKKVSVTKQTTGKEEKTDDTNEKFSKPDAPEKTGTQKKDYNNGKFINQNVPEKTGKQEKSDNVAGKFTKPDLPEDTEKLKKTQDNNEKFPKLNVPDVPGDVSSSKRSDETKDGLEKYQNSNSKLASKEDKKDIFARNLNSKKIQPSLSTKKPQHPEVPKKKLISPNKQNAKPETKLSNPLPQARLSEEKIKLQPSSLLSTKPPTEQEKVTESPSKLLNPKEEHKDNLAPGGNKKYAPSDKLLPFVSKPNEKDFNFKQQVVVSGTETFKKDALGNIESVYTKQERIPTQTGDLKTKPFSLIPKGKKNGDLKSEAESLVPNNKVKSDHEPRAKDSSTTVLKSSTDQKPRLESIEKQGGILPLVTDDPKSNEQKPIHNKKNKQNLPGKRFRILGPRTEAEYLKRLLNHEEIRNDPKLLALLSITDDDDDKGLKANNDKEIIDNSEVSAKSDVKTLRKGNMMFRLEDVDTDIISSKTTPQKENMAEQTESKDQTQVENLQFANPKLRFEQGYKEKDGESRISIETRAGLDDAALRNLKVSKDAFNGKDTLNSHRALDLDPKGLKGNSHEKSDASKIKHHSEDILDNEMKELATTNGARESQIKNPSKMKNDTIDFDDKEKDQNKHLILSAFKGEPLYSSASTLQPPKDKKNFVTHNPRHQSLSNEGPSAKESTIIKSSSDSNKYDVIPNHKRLTEPTQKLAGNSEPLKQALGFEENQSNKEIIMEDEELPIANRGQGRSTSKSDLRLRNERFRRPRTTETPKVTGCRDDQCMTTKDPRSTSTQSAYFNQGRRIINPEEIKCPKGYRRALRNQYIVCEPLRGSAKEEGYKDQLCLPGEDLVELPGGRAECSVSVPGPQFCGENERLVEENGRRRCETVIPDFHCPQGQELVALDKGQGYECRYPVELEQKTTRKTTVVTTTSPRCPGDQHLMDTPLGPLCLPSNFATPVPGKENNLCPSGMTPQMTSIGVICQFKAETLEEQEATPDVNDPVSTESPEPCYPGQILIDTPEGPRCGFAPDHAITGKSETCGKDEVVVHTTEGFQCKRYDTITKDENPCPTGQHLQKRENKITCVYIDDVSDVVTPSNIRCAKDQLLAETAAGFFCQFVDTDKVNLPSCSEEMVLVRTKSGFECISLAESRLECSKGLRMVRTSKGYFCSSKDPTNIDVGGICRPGEITLSSGKVTYCKKLEDNADLCGSGFKPRQNRDGSFVCAPSQTSLLNCPEGFYLSESKQRPECLPLNPHRDLCKDPGFIQMFGSQVDCSAGDLSAILVPCEEGYEIDDVLENGDEGPLCKLVDYAEVVCESANTSKRDIPSCKLENVKSCDVTSSSGMGCKELLEMVLSGCQPQCANGGECVDDKCVCPPGFTGFACEEDINECERLPENFCENDCINTIGSFKCSCPFGSTLNADRRTCKVIDCIPDCLNGGKCFQGVCQCPKGLTGDFCQEDIDECKEGTHHCQALCRNTFGGYGCVCPPGSRLADDGRSCINTTCIPECKNGGRCEDHKCVCPPGFYGIVCQLDVNECDDRGKNECTHHCMNTKGSYKCFCPNGFYLQLDGKTCLETIS